jgi:copper chaperone NosL
VRAWRPAALVAACWAALACSRGAPGPAPLDPRVETCARCRMAVSDPRFAAQLVAPAEVPRFFDDVGCLRDFLRDEGRLPRGAVAFVADHRTRAWIRADLAVYTLVPALETPMSSHLVAHADAASRAVDPEARGGRALTPAEVFGPSGPPRGSP